MGLSSFLPHTPQMRMGESREVRQFLEYLILYFLVQPQKPRLQGIFKLCADRNIGHRKYWLSYKW